MRAFDREPVSVYKSEGMPMHPLDATYRAAVCTTAAAGFPAFWLYTLLSGRYRRGFRQRLGFLPPVIVPQLEGYPRLWVHAVSLGEVQVAASLVRALEARMPECAVLVSSTTDHGVDLARKKLDRRIPVVYAPVDLPFSVRRTLRCVRPHALLFLETELWPAWIAEARSLGISTALLNGRISRRSFEGYRRFRFFFRNVLSKIDVFSMIGEDDARRIRAMGAEPGRVRVNGNAKYELLAEQADPKAEEEMRAALNLGPDAPVLVAGSTRGGEETLLLDAYARIRRACPETVLVIAPRHVERAREIAGLVRGRGLSCRLRSRLRPGVEPRTEPVVILDTFGELFRLYSVATLVFCGASLVPLGGQNPLEPAVWGKPVLYGPHMEDFQEAGDLLESQGAGGTVGDATVLAEEAIRLFRDPRERRERGQRARLAVTRSRGAAERHAAVVGELLAGRTPARMDLTGAGARTGGREKGTP